MASEEKDEEGVAMMTMLQGMAVSGETKPRGADKEENKGEHENYLVLFEAGDGTRTHILVDNATSAATVVKDPETQEVTSGLHERSFFSSINGGCSAPVASDILLRRYLR